MQQLETKTGNITIALSSCYIFWHLLLISNATIFLVQFEINKQPQSFLKTTSLRRYKFYQCEKKKTSVLMYSKWHSKSCDCLYKFIFQKQYLAK